MTCDIEIPGGSVMKMEEGSKVRMIIHHSIVLSIDHVRGGWISNGSTVLGQE